MVFSFPPEERAPFSQPRIDDGARRCGEGAFSVPQHARDGKTQQSKRELRADTCRKLPRYVPYKGTYVPYDGTFGASDQGQTLDV
jgi:hypothetical protein